MVNADGKTSCYARSKRIQASNERGVKRSSKAKLVTMANFAVWGKGALNNPMQVGTHRVPNRKCPIYQ